MYDFYIFAIINYHYRLGSKQLFEIRLIMPHMLERLLVGLLSNGHILLRFVVESRT